MVEEFSNPILFLSNFIINIFNVSSDFGLALSIFSSAILVFFILTSIALGIYGLVKRFIGI